MPPPSLQGLPQQQQFIQLQQPQRTTQSQTQQSNQTADGLAYDVESLALGPPSAEEYTIFVNNLQLNFENHVERTSKRFEIHEERLNWIRYTMENLEQKLATITGAVEKYRTEVDGYRKEVKELRDDHCRVTAEVKGHQQQGQQSQTEDRSLRKEIRKLSAQVAVLVKEHSAFKQKWVEVQDELNLMLDWAAFKDVRTEHCPDALAKY